MKCMLDLGFKYVNYWLDNRLCSKISQFLLLNLDVNFVM